MVESGDYTYEREGVWREEFFFFMESVSDTYETLLQYRLECIKFSADRER
jgi:hypothetical protein